MRHKIRVSAIQRLCLQDGPGVRTTLFLKGCYLACPWCCNPETIHYDKERYFVKDLSFCGKSKVCSSCERYGGGRMQDECPLGAIVKTYTDYEIDELYNILVRDKSLFDRSGGVTLSGGDPLMQAPFLVPLLKRLRDNGIHIAMETSLFAPHRNFNAIKDWVDYWIVDVKFQFGFITYLKDDIFTLDFAENLKWIQQNSPDSAIYRMVLFKQALPYMDDIIDRLQKYHITHIELLLCHQLAENKYKQLGWPVSGYITPTTKEVDIFFEKVSNNGIKAIVRTF